MKQIIRPDKSYLDGLFKETSDIINGLYRIKKDSKENINKINNLFRDINSKKQIGNKQYVFDTYAKESYITDESLDTKDTGEQNIMKKIIEKEKERLSKAS